MKNIDIKSLLIGTLLTSAIFLGVAAAGVTDGKREYQQGKPEEGYWDICWHYTKGFYNRSDDDLTGAKTKIPIMSPSHFGWEPFAVTADGKKTFYRKCRK